jgi:hypothetical protein
MNKSLPFLAATAGFLEIPEDWFPVSQVRPSTIYVWISFFVISVNHRLR